MFGPAKSSAIALLPFLNDESAYNAFNELYDFLESFSRRFSAAKETKCEIDAFFRDSSLASPLEHVRTAVRRGSEYS